MRKLNDTTDLQKYLQFGEIITPFLDKQLVKDKVMKDYDFEDKIETTYDIHNSKTYIPYQRQCVMKSQNIKQHNESIKDLCVKIN